MIDCGFPIIQYPAGGSSREWGQLHGEAFRDGIRELAAIRTDLMRDKNRSLTAGHIEQLARQQWEITQRYDRDLAAELLGIATGAKITLTDLVVLNNYTDFRDIQVDDQGCSLAYVNVGQNPVAGQTWDMHRSAKNYVCCLEIPSSPQGRVVVFSVVGCVGMMGFHSRNGMMGVNNINTNGARAGALWPVIVRATLKRATVSEMAKTLIQAPKTSGHNYLIAVHDQAQMWEVAPDCHEQVDQVELGQFGYIFHTNHCLGPQMQLRETALAQNSTTHIRYALLEKKISHVRNFQQLHELLNDHENYPRSICSNYQADAQDPSVTCGGAVGDLATGQVKMWRGDPLYDDNFVLHEFQMSESQAV